MRRWANVLRKRWAAAGGIRRRPIAFVAFAAVLLAIAGTFLVRQIDVSRLRREAASLRRLTAEEGVRTEELRTRLAKTSDPAVLEDEARRRLGLVKPGEEKIFFLEEGRP